MGRSVCVQMLRNYKYIMHSLVIPVGRRDASDVFCDILYEVSMSLQYYIHSVSKPTLIFNSPVLKHFIVSESETREGLETSCPCFHRDLAIGFAL